MFLGLQGEEERGRKLIQEGIDMKKSLGFSLYAAAGYCDLGSGYLNFTVITAVDISLFSLILFIDTVVDHSL